MFTRRNVITGLLGLVATPALAAGKKKEAAPLVDAVIDISHSTVVNDFHLARRRSNILGVIHKATEGGDWSDPAYAKRRVSAESAGLLWGAYHFGTREYPGSQQAENFLKAVKPGPNTLLALDLELNELNPGNTMRLKQAEDFVRTIFAKTGRKPLIYTNARWAENEPCGRHGTRLGGRITEDSILASCPLWLADYRDQPTLPSAWRGKGWHLWQYAGDADDSGPRGHKVHRVSGIESCDRNFFKGDEATLRKFWTASHAPAKGNKDKA